MQITKAIKRYYVRRYYDVEYKTINGVVIIIKYYAEDGGYIGVDIEPDIFKLSDKDFKVLNEKFEYKHLTREALYNYLYNIGMAEGKAMFID